MSKQSDDTDDGESRYETPPAPETVLDEERISYQAMETLSDAEYARLAADIRERGVLQPVIVDEDDTILDGHHRAAIAEHYDLDASREPAYVVIGDLDTDEAKLARAIKQNLSGRDTTDAVKTHAVKQYIETAWGTTDDGTLIRTEADTEIADKLGVDHSLVSRVIRNWNSPIIYHDRLKAREYYKDNPDASYREVARQVESSQPTVTEWLKEDFNEGDNDDEDDDSRSDTPLNAFARDRGEAEDAQQTVQKAKSGSEDTRVREQAKEKLQEVTTNETDPSVAVSEIEQAEQDDGDTEQEGTDDLEVMTSQKTDEWSSPREVVEPLEKAVGGFDLDPCSGAESSPFAAETYTEGDDGLAQPWNGSVWVNPPYSAVGDWVEKAHEAVTDGGADCVVFLCKGDSSTDWWQTAADASTALCAVDHRLSFGDGGNSAPFASHIFVFGEGSGPLRDALAELGTLLTTGWSQ